MSSAAEGWYVDPSTGTNLRYWNGVTWTDEVAPLPIEAAQPVTVETPAEPAALELPEEPEAMEVPAEETSDAVVHPPLDPELEHTRLTRRELRARRGGDADLDDAPKHLPPVAPPPAAVPEPMSALEEVAIPITAVAEHPSPEDSSEEVAPAEHPSAVDPAQRRTRIVRLSVLLGILAVASSVAVLTAGTL